MIYNIRPINWYTEKKHKHKSFESRKEFVEALHKTLGKYEKTRSYSNKWLKTVENDYKNHTGHSI